MKCPYCDNEVPLNVSSCPSCGAQIQQPAQPQQQPIMGGPQYQQPMNGQMMQMNMAQNYSMGINAKSRVTYILLALFLGGLGIHNFYAGYTKKAVAQLLITILTAGYFVFISEIWAIVEACTVKKYARGIPFK